jgi:1-acyl-sn-glycerol-3-phosphate acyltransferase
MLKIISRIYLKLIGWNIKGSFPEGLKKCVIIAAPHTSMLDFIIGRAAFYGMGINKISFLIKKEAFKFPLGGIIKALGGIPVDRGKSNNMVVAIARQFKEKENMLLIITPEGTRKYVEVWKKGFYHIAENANVPIVLSYVNYREKEGGIGFVLYPSGNYDEDIKIIQEFYKDKTARYPEMFNLSPKNA